MEKIIKILKKNNLNESMLPESIQQKIDSLENLIEKHNQEVDELDNSNEVTEEQEQAIQTQSDLIDSKEDEILSQIESFLESKNEEKEKKAKTDAEAKAKAEADEKAKKEADEKAKNQPPAPKEEKKKSGFGMFILGAVVLIATAGVVNVMNKK